jgi:uncharacterized membrane protein YozB (DUF420 family)
MSTDYLAGNGGVLDGPNVLLGLKVAVCAVTVLLAASLIALARGRIRLHGRINLAFFTLTLSALLGFEVIIRLLNPQAFDYIKGHPELARALGVHLCFAIPAALLMPAMLYTGLKRLRTAHLLLAVLFAILWAGTFITGVFFLPLRA